MSRSSLRPVTLATWYPSPTPVLRELTGRADAALVEQSTQPITVTNGVATGGVWRLRVAVGSGGRVTAHGLVVKALAAPPGDGDRGPGGGDPRHWAYWRREALAYRSGLLPDGPELTAARLLGADETDDRILLYLAEVDGRLLAEMPHPQQQLRLAAHLAGRWQGGVLAGGVPARPWLAAAQLATRIARTDATAPLRWDGLPLPAPVRRRLAGGWAARHRLLAALDAVPVSLCHNDFHARNIFADGSGRLVVIDWGELGTGPVGCDLAHLVLSQPTGGYDGLREAYLDGLASVGVPVRPRLALLGYCVTAGLTGISRTHWTLRRDPDAAVLDYAQWSVERTDEALAICRREGIG